MHSAAMERDAAIEQIEESCKTVSLQLMRLTPAARALGDEEIQADVLKHSYTITIELEAIKKKILKLRNRDDSSDL